MGRRSSLVALMWHPLPVGIQTEWVHKLASQNFAFHCVHIEHCTYCTSVQIEKCCMYRCKIKYCILCLHLDKSKTLGCTLYREAIHTLQVCSMCIASLHVWLPGVTLRIQVVFPSKIPKDWCWRYQSKSLKEQRFFDAEMTEDGGRRKCQTRGHNVQKKIRIQNERRQGDRGMQPTASAIFLLKGNVLACCCYCGDTWGHTSVVAAMQGQQMWRRGQQMQENMQSGRHQTGCKEEGGENQMEQIDRHWQLVRPSNVFLVTPARPSLPQIHCYFPRT